MDINEYVNKLKGESDDSPFFIIDFNSNIGRFMNEIPEILFDSTRLFQKECVESRFLMPVKHRKELP